MRLLIFRWISRDPWRRSHQKTTKKKLWSFNTFCRQESVHRTSLRDVDDKTATICTRYTNRYRYKHTFQSQRMLSFSKSGVHFVLTGASAISFKTKTSGFLPKNTRYFCARVLVFKPLFKPVFGSQKTQQFPAAWFPLDPFTMASAAPLLPKAKARQNVSLLKFSFGLS